MLNIELKLIMSMRERPEEWVRVWFPLRPHVADLGHEGRRGSREKCRRGSYKKMMAVKSIREMRGKEMRRGGKRRGRALSVFPQVSA